MEQLEWIQKNCADKVVSAEKAVSKIKRGSRLFIGSACGEP
jgi:hypothetical protein